MPGQTPDPWREVHEVVSECHTGPRFAVGLDFGTTFSGFAHARIDKPEEVYLYYQYPMIKEASSPYCKTVTASHYLRSAEDGKLKLHAWGWPAYVAYNDALHKFNKDHTQARSADQQATLQRRKDHEVGYYLSRFKLFLAPVGEWQLQPRPGEAHSVPEGLTIDQVIADFIRELGGEALQELKKTYGDHIMMADIAWAITVPAIWDDRAKQRMRRLAAEAGLVCSPNGPDNGGSRHKLRIVLEPEAASACCFRKDSVSMLNGESVLIVDAGGGTVDLAMHTKEGTGPGGLQVREATRSTGALCGGSFVDEEFLAYIQRRIPCLKNKLDPVTKRRLLRNWDNLKCQFSNSRRVSMVLELPRKLSDAWEQYVHSLGGLKTEEACDEIELTGDTMRDIFDPAVNKVISLVRDQLNSFPGDSCKALLMVGGFSESPYLQERIKMEFGQSFEKILRPPSPGAAVCEGAVVHILERSFILSRISRKTYAVAVRDRFREGKDPVDKLVVRAADGERWCNDRPLIFVRNGDIVNNDAEVSHDVAPWEANGTAMHVSIYSTHEREPEYVTDPGMVKEGSFNVPMPDTKRGRERLVKTSMHFGRSLIEVYAEVTNYGQECVVTLPIHFNSE